MFKLKKEFLLILVQRPLNMSYDRLAELQRQLALAQAEDASDDSQTPPSIFDPSTPADPVAQTLVQEEESDPMAWLSSNGGGSNEDSDPMAWLDGENRGVDDATSSGGHCISPLATPSRKVVAGGMRYEVPSLAELCVLNIGSNLHLYSCMKGLPEYITGSSFQ